MDAMYRSASQISFDTVYYSTSAYYPAPAAAVVPRHSRYPFGVEANAPLYPPGLGFGPSSSSIAMATGFIVYDEGSLSAEYDERVEVVEPGKYGAIARPTKPEECRLLQPITRNNCSPDCISDNVLYSSGCGTQLSSQYDDENKENWPTTFSHAPFGAPGPSPPPSWVPSPVIPSSVASKYFEARAVDLQLEAWDTTYPAYSPPECLSYDHNEDWVTAGPEAFGFSGPSPSSSSSSSPPTSSPSSQSPAAEYFRTRGLALDVDYDAKLFLWTKIKEQPDFEKQTPRHLLKALKDHAREVGELVDD